MGIFSYDQYDKGWFRQYPFLFPSIHHVTSRHVTSRHVTAPHITRVSPTHKVLYDPRFSRNGALLTARKAPRREKDPSDFVSGMAIGEIINPNALPMYKVEASNKKRAREMKDPILTKVLHPSLNPFSSPI